MATDTNVVVGCGVPYIATEGVALPTITGTLGTSITWTNWTSLGHNENDFRINFETVYEDFKPAGEVSETMTHMTIKRASGEFKLSETDATAFNYAMASSGITTTVVKDNGVTGPTYRGFAVQTKLTVYHFKRVILNISGDIELDDEKRVVIPVTFKAYARKAETDGVELYVIHERTSA